MFFKEVINVTRERRKKRAAKKAAELPIVSDSERKEAVYMEERRVGHLYVSKRFPYHSRTPDSMYNGEPARLVYEVFDTLGSTIADCVYHTTVWPVRSQRKGRIQVKLVVAHKGDHVREVHIQEVVNNRKDKYVNNILSLEGDDALALCRLFQSLQGIPMSDDVDFMRLDIDSARELVAASAKLPGISLDPEAVRVLVESDALATDVVAVAGRKKVVEHFERLLSDREYFETEKARLGKNGDEAVWQHLFESNPWILGVGLGQHLLTSWNDSKLEQVVSGSSIASKGKRVDALMRTSGAVRSMVFVEIKKPETSLLSGKAAGYRPGVWQMSNELSGGVSQVQATVAAAMKEVGERLESKQNGYDMPGDWTYLFQPRAFLVIGSLEQLRGESGGHHLDKIRSFELYRRNLTSPEVVTFDELLERAKWIVGASEKDTVVTE